MVATWDSVWPSPQSPKPFICVPLAMPSGIDPVRFSCRIFSCHFWLDSPLAGHQWPDLAISVKITATIGI